MVRIKRGNVASKRRKKYFRLSKGFVGANRNLSTMSTEQVVQGLNSAYIGRKLKKRTFRRLWIYRINAASRSRLNIYSIFMGCLRQLSIFLDRKILAFLAFTDISSFNLIERQSRISNIYKGTK